MATANIKAVITAEDRASSTLKGFGNSVDDVGKKISSAFKVAAAVAGAAIGVSIVKNLDDAIKRVDTLGNSARVFDAMGFGAEEVDKAMKALDKSIRGLPTPLNEAVKNVQLLAGSTNDIELSQKIFTALNNAVIGFGGTTEDVTNAVIQLSEAFADGKVDSNAWQSLIQNGLGPALNAIARDMGLTMGELKRGLSEGTISVEEFQEALIKMDKEGGGGMKSFEQLAKDATGGISTAWENMNTAIARSIGKLIEEIGRDRIANIITGIGKAFESSINMVVVFGQKAVEFGKLVAEQVKPHLDELYGVLSRDLIPALSRLWHEVIEPMMPILGILFVGVVITAINVLTEMARVVGAGVDAFLWLKDTGHDLANNIANAFGWIGHKIDDLRNWFNNLPGGIKSALSGIVDIIFGPFDEAFSLIVNGVDRAIDAINKLKGAAGGGGGGGGQSLASRILKGLPGFAAGTSFAPGGAAIVGERGPELVNLPRGSRVTPTHQMPSTSNTTHMSFNVNIGMYGGSELEKRKIAEELFRALSDVATSKGMRLSEMMS